MIRHDTIDRPESQTQQAVSFTSLELLGDVGRGLDSLAWDGEAANRQRVQSDSAFGMRSIAERNVPLLTGQVLPRRAVFGVEDRMATSCTVLHSIWEASTPAPEIGTTGIEVEPQDLFGCSRLGSAYLHFGEVHGIPLDVFGCQLAGLVVIPVLDDDFVDFGEGCFGGGSDVIWPC